MTNHQIENKQGYWVVLWIVISLEEHLIFRRPRRDRSSAATDYFDWTAWDNPRAMPPGLAATVAFLVGWAGAVLSMSQVYYVGPIAKLISPAGGDAGNYVGGAWAAVVYLPLRWLELKRFGR